MEVNKARRMTHHPVYPTGHLPTQGVPHRAESVGEPPTSERNPIQLTWFINHRHTIKTGCALIDKVRTVKGLRRFCTAKSHVWHASIVVTPEGHT